MNTAKPTILIIFGISGDLARRYILQSVAELHEAGRLPDKFHIIGTTRQKDFKKEALIESRSYISKHLDICTISTLDTTEYKKLKEQIETKEKAWGTYAQLLFYLSVPPDTSLEIIKLLSSLYTKKEKQNIKILLEKPFGVDLKSAKYLIKSISGQFNKKQIYRIDHYLFKKVAQEIISSKKEVASKQNWNENKINKIEIVASEQIDIENRINFYDNTGAMRDMVQSHLLELLAVTIMKPPKNKTSQQKLRYKVLKDLKVVLKKTKRAQYEGYTREVGLPMSQTETLVSMTLKSKAKKLKDVSIILTTGKALDKKDTFVKITYSDDTELVFRENPDKKHSPYAEVLYNAINGNKDFFVSQEEILENWRIVSPIQKDWSKNKKDLMLYKKGSAISETLKN